MQWLLAKPVLTKQSSKLAFSCDIQTPKPLPLCHLSQGDSCPVPSALSEPLVTLGSRHSGHGHNHSCH